MNCVILDICSSRRFEEDFIQNVQELHHIMIPKGVTYTQFFGFLLTEFSNQPEHKEAIQRLFDYNEEEYYGTSALQQPVSGIPVIAHLGFRE